MACSSLLRLMIMPFVFAVLVTSVAHGAIVEHTFNVGNLSISQLCQPARIITAVNGQLPGPTINTSEGDTVVIHLVNTSPYNMTIHWHGRGSQWADGPAMITQCPVRPGSNYTYRFNVTNQEGTLWWHAHISFLRATVYGAIVIKPRGGADAYPFPKPDNEQVILLGEWWNANVYDLERMAFLTGIPARSADAYTINGKPGDFYNCSDGNNTYMFQVRRNETNLLRIINAALNTPLFVKLANHSFTVVAADASYTTPYPTDVVVISPGQTVDALLVPDADAAASPRGRYYIAASPYDSAIPNGPAFSQTTATAIVEYVGEGTNLTSPPNLPPRPEYNDTPTAHRFFSNLTALIIPGNPTVPLAVDTRMFVTIGLGVSDCQPAQLLCNRSAPPVFAASMNNNSFVPPTKISMLEAHFNNATEGVYTRDFPDTPPVVFDYTGDESDNATLQYTNKTTKVKTLRYNETVEMVLQDTRLIAKENHPMHIHGINFFVLAQGFGNYDEVNDPAKFNFVNPQERNTIAVPTGGWAVIRFVANNPGMWYMHCHYEAHLDFGLAMVFEVLDGPTPETSLPPPPADLPHSDEELRGMWYRHCHDEAHLDFGLVMVFEPPSPLNPGARDAGFRLRRRWCGSGESVGAGTSSYKGSRSAEEVGNMSISQLCMPERIITAVNGQLPGPTIFANEGDTVVVHMVNESPHGIFQRGTQWADGPAMVTQCPVHPGGNYTYRFNVTGQEGTLWWHAHISFHRATVYGALIIKPRGGAAAYPFPKPDEEEIVILGEWWNADVNQLHVDATETGRAAPHADNYTINGKPGASSGCADPNQTHKFELKQNKTYMLRIINAGLNTPLFFKIANHSFNVVAADACYTKPYTSDIVVVSPGQTVDALLIPDAGVAALGGSYYMAVTPYNSAANTPANILYSLTTATAVVEYSGSTPTVPPVMPRLPEYGDTATAHRFWSNMTALVPNRVPLAVKAHMFVTVGMGDTFCGPEQTRCMPNPAINGTIFASSMNNASFILPKTTSMLEAMYRKNSTGVYTRDFPDTPPIVFDYTANVAVPEETTLKHTFKSTKVRKLKYNETVQMVLQNTRLVDKESHPMHLHGFNFFVLAQDFGNYNETTDPAKFNLIDPQERNTVAVPTGGWAVIRFVADNPGMWFMHCHFDSHLDFGLGMVFEVEDGPTPDTKLPPPPSDLPQC
uniref:Laccase n=1 Tax=Leersia perrieri TaxID=77586 RepID=A0A0D9XYA3_9ORYZ